MSELITSLEQAGEGVSEAECLRIDQLPFALAMKVYRALRFQRLAAPVGGWEDISTAVQEMADWVDGDHLPLMEALAVLAAAKDMAVYASEGSANVAYVARQCLARFAPPPPSVSIDNGSRPQEAVPTCDADGLADKLAKVRDLLRQIWEADSHLVWTGNPPEPSHDEEGECAKLANEAAVLITGIIGQPADGCSSNEGAGQ